MSIFGIVLLLIIVIFSFFVFYDGQISYKYIKHSIYSVCGLLILIFAISTMYTVIIESSINPSYVEKVEEKELVSFGNNTFINENINGLFFLGCGSINNKVGDTQYYYFLVKEKDGLKFEKIYLNDINCDVYIKPYENNENNSPKIVYYKKGENIIYSFYKIFLKKENWKSEKIIYKNYKIVINVPKNSIIYSNIIDINKF